MKYLQKFILGSVLALGLFLGLQFSTPLVYATSGACSSHGGVNCSAGADSDGSVICYDGWEDSSVSYSSMVMCDDDYDYDYSYVDEEEEEEVVDYNAVCEASYGEHAAAHTTSCYCETGYEMESGACVLIEDTAETEEETTAEESVPVEDSSTEDVEVFSDLSSSDPEYEAVSALYDAGVIQGYSDGTYKPDASINRAEFSKILMSAQYGILAEDYSYTETCFSDVSSSDWYAPYVCFAQLLNIVSGYPDGDFKPTNEINVAEALKITLEAFAVEVPESEGEWYEAYVNYATEHDCYLDSWTSVDQKITRGEMAELIFKIMNP